MGLETKFHMMNYWWRDKNSRLVISRWIAIRIYNSIFEGLFGHRGLAHFYVWPTLIIIL